MKVFLKFSRCFVISVVLCILFGILTSLIPREAIEDKSSESVDYMMEHSEMFPLRKPGQMNTRYENHTDCILLNVAWNLDETNPWTSMVQAAYLNIEQKNANIDLRMTVKEGVPPNVMYFRYWHGGAMLLRVLLLFLSIQNIRRVLFAVLIILAITVMKLLGDTKKWLLLPAYLIGILFVEPMTIGASVAYELQFLVMHVLCIYTLWQLRHQTGDVLKVFIIGGVLTAFFDFLTVETTAFTVPLFLILIFGYESKKYQTLKSGVCVAAGGAMTFCVSYLGMFFLKWVLAMGVLGKNSFVEAMSSAMFRVGSTQDMAYATRWETITRNISCLFPVREGTAYSRLEIISFLFLAVYALLWLLAMRRKETRKMNVLLGLVGLIPYARFFMIFNHSYLHYFFTYRAQIITVMVMIWMAEVAAGYKMH